MALPNTRRTGEERRLAMRGVRSILFLGIGGVHMSSLALLAQERGYRVFGMDRVASERVRRLVEAGIPVSIGESADGVETADAVVYTLAISPEHPAYAAALARGITLFSRADFLGFLTQDAACRVAIAGCHGKSTVTAWLGEMMGRMEHSPTVLCGATMRHTGMPLARGHSDCFVMEACEYGDSFLALAPTLAVVLNVGYDHADYFPDLGAVKASFARFVEGAEQVLVNADDAAAMEATAGVTARRVTFGLAPDAMLRAEHITFSGGMGRFSLLFEGRHITDVALQVPGRHNVYNALAAAGAARLCGLSAELIHRGLANFRGVLRRMEYKGRLCGARVLDDYAHHPDEIAATLRTAREMLDGHGRLVAVFQPHTYTRTAALWQETCRALRLADRVLLAEIYAARELPLPGISSTALAAEVGSIATCHPTLPALAAALTDELLPEDLLVVMGAGDIDGIFREFSGKDFTL